MYLFALRRSAPQKVKDRKIDSESRSLITQKRLEQVDTISSWELLTEFHTLSLLKSQKYHRECHFHWKFLKIIQYLVLRKITKTYSNDLINSFTHKTETFSQIELILERKKEAKHRLPKECS